MKKIITREIKEKKETRNKVIVGSVLIILMILSTIGYSFFSGGDEAQQKIEYKGVEFVLTDNSLWQFNIGGRVFQTQYNPVDTQNISVSVARNLDSYSGKPLFFLGEDRGKQELARNLNSVVSRMQESCLEDYEEYCTEDSPLKDCEEDNIIIIEEIEKTEEIEIKQEENCIFISAPYQEQIRAADAFLFKILKID